MDRINQKDLEILADRINEVTKSPKDPWTRANGKTKANIGNYHIDGAYGGWKLVRMVNTGGAISEVTYGFVPKRELYNLMHAFLGGLENE